MVNKNKEKESDRESIDKKRRKTGSGSSTSNTDSSNLSKALKEDIYTTVVKFEESESLQRSAETDAKLFRETCNELRTLFGTICNLKKNYSDKVKNEIIEKRIEGSFQFVCLKKLNRLDKVRLRAGRDTLHKEKLRVDSNILQLQNLLYEAAHLKKEVQRCLQFKSQDEEIELVSEEEFYTKAPNNISRPDKTENDEHARRLARLEWELQQRKELATLCKELQLDKEKVANDIESKTNRLDSLTPRLDGLLQATRPLQEALEMDIEKDWEVQKIARLLPQPLYLVYANLNAYAEACDKLLIATIHGDEEEAKQLEDNEKEILDDNDEEDSDIDDPDNERVSKSHHHRRISKSSIKEIKQSNLFKPHPLYITFKLNSKSTKASLAITLYYLPTLGFITAICNLIDFENIGSNAGDVVAPNNILTCLNDDDFGEESSNPKTIYQLKDLSLDPKKLIEFLEEKNLGKPYKWAQKLCGLDFVSSTLSSYSTMTANNDISYDLAQESVPDIIKQIRKRWQARIKLHEAIYALEHKDIENINITNDDALIRVSCVLQQFASITWSTYIMEPSALKYVEGNFATVHHLLYKCIVVRGAATLTCFICISPNFPAQLPLWAITLNWNGIFNSYNNSTIREMEYWINSIERPKKCVHILGIQLKRAMSSLDIFLETESLNTNSHEFPPDKTFLRAFRGRTRSRPFKIIRNGGNSIYTHI